MDADDWPDWLPFDWTVHIKKIDGRTVKCYDDSKGHIFYSKPDVLGYLKKTNKSAENESTIDLSTDPNAPPTNEASESLPGGRPTKLTPRTSRRKSSSRNLSEDAMASDGEPLSSERTDRDSWLPEGWTVEVKVRQGGNSSGMRYKCYTDPESGQKFFSKPQVLHHLAKTNRSAGKQKEVLTEPIVATPISAWQEKSTTEPDKSKTNEVKKSGTGNTVKSARLSSDYEVMSRTPVEGLPEGWIKEVRQRKNTNKKDPYYLDPSSEYAFFSKKDVLRYLETGDVRSCVMKPILRDVNMLRAVENDDIHDINLSASIEELIPPSPPKVTETPKKLPNASVEESKTNESDTQSPKRGRSITGGVFNTQDEEKNSNWLPDGWVVETNYKNSGQKFKVFKEVASGKKFYSKPQVLNYLNGGSSSNSIKRKERKPSAASGSTSNATPADATRPKRTSKKTGDNKNGDFQEIITTSAADGLPPGWIKEIRTKIYATHKRSDPFYTDPESGYIFRSKMDAMRYLDTGDVTLCAIRPKVKDETGKEVFVSTNGAQKPAKPTTGKQPLEDTDDGMSTENHEDSTKRKTTPVKNTKQNNPAASSPGQRSSKRQKGIDPTSAGGQGKPAPWVNLEKQPADDGNGNLFNDMPEDDNWTDQCIDFAVKTLANEILFNGQPLNGPSGFNQEEKSETPTKVN